MSNPGFDPHGTTILSVRRGKTVAMGGDGQVTLGNTVVKGNAKKVRRLYNDKVLAGFAGGTADAFTLFERFEGKLEKYGNLTRAAIELAKDWRADRALRAEYFWVPNWYKGSHWVAWWDQFGRPAVKPAYDRGILDTWWFDAAKAAKLKRGN